MAEILIWNPILQKKNLTDNQITENVQLKLRVYLFWEKIVIR